MQKASKSLENQNVIKIEDFGRIAIEPRSVRPPRDLVPSEVEAMVALGRFVTLTPELFKLFSGYGESEAMRGLRFLFMRGLADRGYYLEPRTDAEIAASAPRVPKGLAYKLTRKGRKKAIELGLISPEAPHISGNWRGAAPRDMGHRLISIEFMIRMARDIARQDRWIIGRTIYDFLREDKKSATREELSGSRFIVPDIIFDLDTFFDAISNKVFVEVENTKLRPVATNEKDNSITRKLGNYTSYLLMKSRKHKGQDGDALVYVQNQDSDHLDQCIKDINWKAVGDARELVRMTTLEDVRVHGVLNGIWRDWQGNIVGLV